MLFPKTTAILVYVPSSVILMFVFLRAILTFVLCETGSKQTDKEHLIVEERPAYREGIIRSQRTIGYFSSQAVAAW